MIEFLQSAKKSSQVLSTLDGTSKNKVLKKMANELEEKCDYILDQNSIDIQNGKKNNLSKALIDRLFLDKSRVQAMANSIRTIANLKDPIGRVLDGWKNEQNLNIQKVSVPIGVIGIIYESRPNVTSDTAALCFKSGNVCILKGGKEAMYSNKAIATILQNILVQNHISKDTISLLPDYSRSGVDFLIKQDKYVDLIIPRGGEELIKYISKNSSVPIIKHDKGLCHTYIDKSANAKMAIDISINAKCQRTGVCNAMETLLIHKDIAMLILPALEEEFNKYKTNLRGCNKTINIINIQKATKEDYQTEYLDNILSIKIVDDLNDAVSHINEYGSGHSEAIISENYTSIEYFLNNIDASCVYANASTRFTDGEVFGFGAEVGISTSKLHSRGPMGINDLTSYKFKIYGNGQIKK
jgi:glutamate-5-semialdehyde dehydrogenase